MSLNMAAFGKEVGVSRATVSLWKGEGMPVSDRDGAVSWLAEHRPKYVEKLVGAIVQDGAGAPPSGGGGLEGLDIHSTLERFREIELRGWADLDKALEARKDEKAGTVRAVKLDAEISRLDKRYKQAAVDVMDMEKRVAEFDLETGRRVSMDRVKEFMNDRFAGMKVLVEALPYMESRNCNPDDPETAQRELQRWVNNFLRQQEEVGSDA